MAFLKDLTIHINIYYLYKCPILHNAEFHYNTLFFMGVLEKASPLWN